MSLAGAFVRKSGEQAVRLGLVTLVPVVALLVAVVETPPRAGGRIGAVPGCTRAELHG